MIATAPVLKVEDLVVGYDAEVDILNGVSIAVEAQEIVTVVGPNGAGKSTLMKAIFGLLEPKGGRVFLAGASIAGLRPSEVARLGVGYVPQIKNVFPSLTVAENLEMGLSAAPGKPLPHRLEAMYGLFPRLAERRRQSVGTMSGGERQMVAIARALMPEPSVLLLDEPSAGLAPILVEGMFAQIQAINRRGIAILMVEQNARQALALSDRGYVLDLGRNRHEGRGRDLLDDPRVAELYLGAPDSARNEGHPT
jgi:ABC-type branched-subunit amino acid transport system ATPase component